VKPVRLAGLAALLALAAAGPARCQAPPDAPPHPLAGLDEEGGDDAPSVPAWEGVFGIPGVRVWLHPGAEGFAGALEVAGRSYPLAGAVSPDGGLEGALAAGRESFAFAARLRADGALEVTTGGETLVLGPGGAAAADGAGGGSGRPALPHVEVGRRFVFESLGGLRQVWEVVAVERSDDGVTVRYTITSHLDMGDGLQPIGEPVEQEWSPAPDGLARWDAPGVVDGGRRELDVDGRAIPCRVVTSGAGATRSTTWLPVAGGDADAPTFPPVARIEQDGRTMFELVRIE